MKKIIFVCTGNTCRSPMAAGIATDLLNGKYKSESFGLSANPGDPPSENAVTAMKEIGIDISKHRAERISSSDIEKADLIIALSASHYNFLSGVKGTQGKLFLLGSGISDPFMQDIGVYRNCRDEIRKAVADMLLDVDISPMSEKDVPQIALIEAETFSSPWSENGLSAELFKENSHFFAARFGDTVLGYIGCYLCADEAYIANIAVKKKYRRLGIGRKLIKTAAEQVRAMNARFITLEVRSSNNIAKKMYENLGFEKVGERRGFYTNPKENADLYTLYFNKER